MIDVKEGVSLAQYSTMRLGGRASFLTEIHARNDIKLALEWAERRNLPTIMIGGGSNIIWRDEGFSGLVMVNRILGYDCYVSLDSHFVTIGAGEIWDSVVARTVSAGLTGIEALSLIPGTAGATPVQNVGAYGQELSRVITSIEVFDVTTGLLTTVPPEACGFSYRHSKFQDEYKKRFFITAITLHLTVGNPLPPYYSAVEKYLTEHPVSGGVTPRVLRDAVIDIRTHKLPDPTVVANAGSFFRNPIVDKSKFYELLAEFPTMPHWSTDDEKIKISAAWLIEQIGYKNVHDKNTGMATWQSQPLVLVNENANSTADLLRFRDEIIVATQDHFGVSLHQEPELLP